MIPIRILLINPNTNVETTDRMVDIARGAARSGVEIAGLTAAFGVPLITDPGALAVAANAVEARLQTIDTRDVAGVIVAAFGDPALDRLRNILSCPVTGIAEAGLAEAGVAGRRFAIATTTPDLVASIADVVRGYGHADRFIGTYVTAGDIDALMRDPERLAEALYAASRAAVADGAEAVVIGGGPLAEAARAIASRVPVPVIEPIPAAVRLAIERGAPGGSLGRPAIESGSAIVGSDDDEHSLNMRCGHAE